MENDYNTSEANKEIGTINSCLQTIFYCNNKKKYVGILKSTNKIYVLLHSLFKTKNDHSLNYLLDIFINLFQQSPYLIDVFHHILIKIVKPYIITYNMSDILLDIFFRSITPEQGKQTTQIQEKIITCFNIILSHRNTSKDSYEFLFQRLSNNLSNNKKKEEIDQNELYHSIKLLQTLYGKYTFNTYPDNYFYFAGKGFLEVNIQSITFIPSLGFTITFWFFIEYDLKQIDDLDDELKKSILINIKNVNQQEIQVELLDSKIKVILDNKELKVINDIEPRKWYQLSFGIKTKHLLKSPSIQLMLYSPNSITSNKKDKDKHNKEEENIYIQGFNLDKPLERLYFFKNFIGRVTSLVYVKGVSAQPFVMPYGIYESNILKNSFKLDYQHYIKAIPSQFHSSSNNIIIPDHFVDNLNMLFVPFHYENKMNYLDDIIMHFTATFQSSSSLYTNGVMFNGHYNNCIQMIGGFSVLLPIIEQLYLIINIPKEENIFNDNINRISCNNNEVSFLYIRDSLIEYFELISLIVQKSNSNYELANSKFFFFNLSLFLVKFPKYLFSNDLMRIFCQMGQQLSSASLIPEFNTIHFFNCILLNEKIIFKFSYELQIDLWKTVNLLIVEKIKAPQLMSMSKLCLVLKAYDSPRYTEFCCSEHREIFTFNPKSSYGDKGTMNPEMKTKIEHLKNLILFLLIQSPDNVNRDNEIKEHVLLFKLLSLDLSPCLQKFIITIFKLYFTESKVSNNHKETMMETLFASGFVDVTLYVMSISLMDVKYELIDLLRILVHDYNRIFIEYYIRNKKSTIKSYLEFIKENILPCNIVIEEDTVKEIMIDSLDLANDDQHMNIELDQEEKKETVVVQDEEEDKAIIKKAPLTSKNSNKVSLNFSFLQTEITKNEDEDDNTNNTNKIENDTISINNNNNDCAETNLSLRSALRNKKNPKENKFLSFSLDIENIENDNDNNQKVNNGELIGNSPKENSEIFKQAEKAIKPLPIDHQKKKHSTKNIVSDNPLRRSHDIFINLRLDTKKINQEAEENEANFQTKVFQLAKHCVDYIKGEDYLGCNNKQFKKNGRFNSRRNSNDKLQYHKKRTLQSIHEDELESRLSINKTPSITDTMKRIELKSKIELIMKQNQNSFNYELQELPIGHKYLVEYFEKENYNKSIDQLFLLLIKWLNIAIHDTQSILESQCNSESFINDIKFQKLIVIYLIQSLIKIFSMTCKISLILKLLIYLTEQIDVFNPIENKTLKRNNTIAYNTTQYQPKKSIQSKIMIGFPKRKVMYFLLYNNALFYQWLLDTAFQCYLIINDKGHNSIFDNEENKLETALKIYDKFKLVLTLLIFESITSNESSSMNQFPKTDSKGDFQIDKINVLLSWGIYQRCIYHHSPSILLLLSNFLNDIMVLTLTTFTNELTQKKVYPSINDKLWYSFLSFTCYCFEYLLIYNNNQKILEGGRSYIDPNNEYIIIPPHLFDGLSKIYNQNIQIVDKLEDIWLDYRIVKIILDNYKQIWNYNEKLLNLSNYSNRDNTSLNKYYILKRQLDKIVEELIFSKKKQNCLGLEMLFYSFKDKTNTSMSVPLIIIISNLIVLTISILKENSLDEGDYWINQYKEFIVYCIVASLNMSLSDKHYNEYQQVFYSVILFAFNFLIEQSFLNIFQDQYRNALVTITYLFSRIILEKRAKEHQSRGSIKKLLGIKPLDISQRAFMMIMSQYEVYSDLINEKLFDIDKMIYFSNSKDEIDYDKIISFYQDNLKSWKKPIISSGELKVIRQTLFNTQLYEEISKKRFEDIGLIIPCYEIQPEYAEDEFVKKIPLKVSPRYVSRSYNDERKRVSISIKELIPFIKKEIKRYSKSYYTEDKLNRNIYQKFKKKLFSWRGAWSNKEVFFTKTKLKYKVLNHYTSEFSKPLLAPILDLNYYLPPFTKFDKSNLFMNQEENSKVYGINIDLRTIFQNKSDRHSFILSTSTTLHGGGTFYLKSIYESSFNNKIWDHIQLDLGNEECVQTNQNIDHNNKNIVVSHKEEFTCCIVKITHHIQGTLVASRNKIMFSIEQNKERNNENDIYEYDVEKGTCYGSIFVQYIDNETYRFILDYSDITFILKRKYFFHKTGLEIFTLKNKSYFFNFQSQKDRDKVIGIIKEKLNGDKILIDECKDEPVIGYKNPKYNCKQMRNLNLSTIISNWKKWKMSTFEFLMWLNLYSNRSYRDITQYPVFPWAFTNYKDRTIQLAQVLRNFEQPIGMLEVSPKSIQRKEEFITMYVTMKNEELSELSKSSENEMFYFDKKPYCYGSHYSNAIYVSHYLLRLFPYSSLMIELQGNKFDDPDRIFFCLEKTFESATSNKSDVRELCPEFYCLPEMFININQLDFGVSQNEDNTLTQVMNVELPPWCNNDVTEYVKLTRRVFEGVRCSNSINHWVDLIFGSKQKGKKAEEAFNVFFPYSYENNVDYSSKKDKEDVLTLIRFLEMGITPTQIIFHDLEHRHSKPQSIFFNSGKLKSSLLISLKQFKPDYLSIISDSIFITLNQNNAVNEFALVSKVTENEIFKAKSNCQFDLLKKECLSPLTFKIKSCHYDYKRIDSIVVYNKGNYIAEGGYWDGRIIVSERSKENDRKYVYVYCECDPSPILIIKLNKDESTAYCGNKSGSLIVFNIQQLQWKYYTRKCNHTEEITSICLNDQLNIIATSSVDGYVALYTLPTLFNFRVIQMQEDFADHVFLSICPVPCIVMYSNNLIKFYSYSINGTFYKEISKNKHNENKDKNINTTDIEPIDNLISPLIFKDSLFSDYLIYGTYKGEIVIRRFPSMEVIKTEKIFENSSIYSLSLSLDLKYVLALR